MQKRKMNKIISEMKKNARKKIIFKLGHIPNTIYNKDIQVGEFILMRKFIPDDYSMYDNKEEAKNRAKTAVNMGLITSVNNDSKRVRYQVIDGNFVSTKNKGHDGGWTVMQDYCLMNWKEIYLLGKENDYLEKRLLAMQIAKETECKPKD